MIDFDEARDAYHIQLLKVPKGYSFDPDFELNLDHGYGEWLLCLCRNEAKDETP